jgi:hypothetical protein
VNHSKACVAYNGRLDCHGYYCLGTPKCGGPDTAKVNANIVQVSLSDLRTLLTEAQRPAPPALLTSEQIAHELGISRTVLGQLRREGLPCVTVSGRARYELADVLSWLRGRGGKSCPENDPENYISPKVSGSRG